MKNGRYQLSCAGMRWHNTMTDERDPLEILQTCLNLMRSADISALSVKGRRAFNAVLSYNSWIIKGGGTVKWGDAGTRALQIISELAELLWPEGEFSSPTDENSEDMLLAVRELLRFSGFGPQEGL